MRIIENPTDRQLNDLQKVLENDPGVGIVDIWTMTSPFYLVAEDGGVAVGVASTSLGEGVAELYKLYVVPSYRGKQVGRQLVDYVIRKLRARYVEELIVEIAGDSYGFWQKLAWEYQLNDYGPGKFGMLINMPHPKGD
jgi:GNAT superfamily N-acetyltransferase